MYKIRERPRQSGKAPFLNLWQLNAELNIALLFFVLVVSSNCVKVKNGTYICMDYN